MQTILARLKSPVIWIQIIGTIVGVIIFFLPNQAQAIQVVDGAIVAIINLLSGLNNPTNSTGF
jgi:nicotinamide riboside transporter PnuC